MALPSWQATIVRDNGDTIPGAEVEVVLESTGTAATIYSDRNGATALSPPYFADSDGYFIFYAADAEYRITATDSGTGFTRTWRYVSLISADGLGTAATRDAIGAGDVYARGGILGTVSQSGGVPTGAIIERGSNSNGEYVKFADGTLICTKTTTFTETDAGERLGAPDWTYPTPFVASPFFSNIGFYASVSTGTTGWVAENDSHKKVSSWGMTTTSQTVATQLRIWAATGQAFAAGEALSDVKLLAIGRWY